MIRIFVRLGEHDTTRNSDGPHQDVIVTRVQKHWGYNIHLKINDIGILYLERDVDFTGKLILFFVLFLAYEF